MLRGLALLLILAATAGVLSLSCSQEQTTKPDSPESASEQPEQKPLVTQGPTETDTTETKPEKKKKLRTEEEKKEILERRKEQIDKQTAEGLYTDISTEGPVTKVYVDDKFHDLKKRRQIFSIKNLYIYYKATNPEMKALVVYDQNTGAEIANVSLEGFKWKYQDTPKDQTPVNKADEKAQ